MAKLKGATSIPLKELLELVRSDDDELSDAAFRTIASRCPADPGALPALARFAGDRDAVVRHRAQLWLIKKLPKLRIHPERRLFPLAAIIKDLQWQEPASGRLTEKAWSERGWVHCAVRDGPRVRARAAELLRWVGDARDTRALLECLKDKDDFVHYWALLTLRYLGDASAIPVIEKYIDRGGPNSATSQLALRIISKRAKRKPPARRPFAPPTPKKTAPSQKRTAGGQKQAQPGVPRSTPPF